MNEIIKNNGIKFGIICGLVYLSIDLYAFLFDLNLFGSILKLLWLLLFLTLFFIIINIVLLNKTKKALNGVFSFKEAFTTFFISLTISLLFSTLFQILIFNVIDPTLGEQVKELTINSTVEFMKKLGASSSDIKASVEQMKTSPDNYSIINLIKGYFIKTVILSIFGVIFSLIFKSKPKEQF
ncbi:DUF4199 domain-containing protein [Flavobacterium sp. NRK F7]|uniref:DUF4199 domain-containing protein n=1 Tax=Flavobacterium sp. NRK F7 TaxID=2954930 RepID=UPI0020905C2E|nr:DUF4199 domain-containing protein [Flavobacterium sp. NRK F7]MCO6162636.1 DUF4199 domain-containing protein [Flavobacterium sp. NRK F7]